MGRVLGGSFRMKGQKMKPEELSQKLQYQTQKEVDELQTILNKLNGMSLVLSKAMKNGVVVDKKAYNDFAQKYNDLVKAVDFDLNRAKLRQAKTFDLEK
ncbi:hypothetical protein LEQ_0884c [Ligilactobacillus equi DPC 6820]|uniref:Uncharacterized protein n=2 Tax=Ligilactobacillus equi TaxID=137357 RepID=V7HWG8_9LACO|nr:hypothetical protein LEQ_0884c [Ligilactobacillus equi DPC 6820]